MAYVYILKSQRYDKYYIGCASDVEKRVREHNSGKVYSTKRLMPLKLVFQQKCPNMMDARYVEMKLKKLKRRDYLEKIVEDGYIKFMNEV